MFKKIISAITTFLILVISTISVAVHADYSNEITVKLNGDKIEFTEIKPFVDSCNRVQVPVRMICEAAGINVLWESDTKTVSIYSDSVQCNFIIGSSVANVTHEVNGVKEKSFINMDTEAIIVEDYTYIPVAYLAQALSMVAEWDSNTYTVSMRPMQESDFSEHFPLDSFFPKSMFAVGYTDDNVPEELLSAFSKTDVIYGEDTFTQIPIDYNNSIDLSNSVYRQSMKFTTADDKTWVETPVFDICDNLVVNVSVNCDPVWLTVELAQIDSTGKITSNRRLWHDNAVDESITINFDNLDTSLKYFVRVLYTNDYTPEITEINGHITIGTI